MFYYLKFDGYKCRSRPKMHQRAILANRRAPSMAINATMVDPIPALTSIPLSRRFAPKILSAGPCHRSMLKSRRTSHSKKAAPISQISGTNEPPAICGRAKCPPIALRWSVKTCKPATNKLATNDTDKPMPVPVIKVINTNWDILKLWCDWVLHDICGRNANYHHKN